MQNVTVVDHPLVQHKLSLMRRKSTPTAMFRQLIREISMLLGYEVTRDLPMGKERIETPIMEMDAPVPRPVQDWGQGVRESEGMAQRESVSDGSSLKARR